MDMPTIKSSLYSIVEHKFSLCVPTVMIIHFLSIEDKTEPKWKYKLQLKSWPSATTEVKSRLYALRDVLRTAKMYGLKWVLPQFKIWNDDCKLYVYVHNVCKNTHSMLFGCLRALEDSVFILQDHVSWRSFSCEVKVCNKMGKVWIKGKNDKSIGLNCVQRIYNVRLLSFGGWMPSAMNNFHILWRRFKFEIWKSFWETHLNTYIKN